jgi:aspartate/methionine/tyrosine aminotransferase
LAIDDADAAELAAIEQAEAEIRARRDRLASKWGEGVAVMDRPGAPYVMLVIKGKIHALAVRYLSGGATPP